MYMYMYYKVQSAVTCTCVQGHKILNSKLLVRLFGHVTYYDKPMGGASSPAYYDSW